MATAVGLDIGTHAIKVTEVRTTRQGVSLLRLGRRATPIGATKSGVIVKPREVAAEISALLKELRLRPRNVVTAVAGQGVIVRTLLMPLMSRDETAEAVKWEVQAQLPFPVDECVYDFDVTGEVLDESDGQMRQKIGLVAARREIIDSFVETLGLCRMLPKVIDIQPFGIARSLNVHEYWSRISPKLVSYERGEPRDSAAEETVPTTDQAFNRNARQLPGLDDLEHMSLGQLRSLASELDHDTTQAAGDHLDAGVFGCNGTGSFESFDSLDLAQSKVDTPDSEWPAAQERYDSVAETAATAAAEVDQCPCMAVLDIGAGTTDFVVFSGAELTFTRIIPLGGNAITEAISSAVHCRREDAEELKRTTDWVEGANLESGEPADPLIVSAIESVVIGMAREVRRTVDFYNASHKDGPIRGGILVGGGAKLIGLVEHLSYELEMPIVIGHPYANVSVDQNQLDATLVQDAAPVMAVSVGLALRGAEEL